MKREKLFGASTGASNDGERANTTLLLELRPGSELQWVGDVDENNVERCVLIKSYSTARRGYHMQRGKRK